MMNKLDLTALCLPDFMSGCDRREQVRCRALSSM